MEVQESIRIKHHGSEGDCTVSTTVKQEVGQIKSDNWAQAEQSNGFWDGRTGRNIASLPLAEHMLAIQMGYNLDATDPKELKKELYRYLAERGRDQGVQTVKHLLTPGRNANIIVR